MSRIVAKKTDKPRHPTRYPHHTPKPNEFNNFKNLQFGKDLDDIITLQTMQTNRWPESNKTLYFAS